MDFALENEDEVVGLGKSDVTEDVAVDDGAAAGENAEADACPNDADDDSVLSPTVLDDDDDDDDDEELADPDRL